MKPNITIGARLRSTAVNYGAGNYSAAELVSRLESILKQAKDAATEHVGDEGEPAHCSACGWSGRCALPLESLPPKGPCPRCGMLARGLE